MVELPFLKIHGCGNDFVLMDLLSDISEPEWISFSRSILDRRTGIGADGLLIIKPSKVANFRVDLFNPDGSDGQMCGNGIRCVCRYLVLKGIIEHSATNLSLDFAGRRIGCELFNEGKLVRVDMGVPDFSPASIPINSSKEALGYDIQLGAESFKIWAVSIGNPHCVIFVPSVDLVPIEKIGPLLERHTFFPNRTNVEFVEIEGRDSIKVRVWERGAGLTLACGTAACATVVAASVSGQSNSKCKVALPGGDLQVEWNRESNRIYLTGPAQEVFEGKIFLP